MGPHAGQGAGSGAGARDAPPRALRRRATHGQAGVADEGSTAATRKASALAAIADSSTSSAEASANTSATVFAHSTAIGSRCVRRACCLQLLQSRQMLVAHFSFDWPSWCAAASATAAARPRTTAASRSAGSRSRGRCSSAAQEQQRRRRVRSARALTPTPKSSLSGQVTEHAPCSSMPRCGRATTRMARSSRPQAAQRPSGTSWRIRSGTAPCGRWRASTSAPRWASGGRAGNRRRTLACRRCRTFRGQG